MTRSAADKSQGDPEAVARLVALRLLESRPRTRAELERALAGRGVPEDAATAVLDRFTEVGLIDDQAFASAWVTSRHTGRGLGRRALGTELRRRGVEEETIQSALETVSSDDELIAARALAQRRQRTMARLDREVQVRRLAGMLARRGFGQGVALRVAVETVDAASARSVR